MTFLSRLVDEEQPLGLISETPIITRSPTSQTSSPSTASQSPITPRKISIRVDKDSENDGCHLTIPKVIAVSSSSETLTGTIENRYPRLRYFMKLSEKSPAA